ncbi:hypothetical protein [Haloterrigena salifodinae]|uniref:Uncharacterized protein n=1 Tax=Haloterrigena salifodinae TaxID=2675099 RepID=A0A8T8E4D1_9EURY|nr:hypothetical protein [Haloterrigena salifodinae]QRV16734.1 hypothetical protein JMJ58_07665 [Haloterrigena salifodinae]
MSTQSRPLEQEVRDYVREHYERGNSHIKTPHVAKALDQNSQRITPIMQDMVRGGTLAVWNESTNATVYRIQL